MNILYIVSPNIEAASDALIVGLTRIGFKYGENLIVYPYKRNLHCTDDYYWCYGFPGIGCIQTANDLGDLVRTGFFDVAFISDIWTYPYLHDLYEFVLSYLDDLPCVLIHATAEPFSKVWSFRDLNFVAKFFREKKPADDGYPISFSVLEGRMGKAKKEFDTFFAGVVDDPHRKAFVDALTVEGYPHIYHEHFDDTHSGYTEMLRKARVTFSFSRYDHHNLGRVYRGAAQGACMFIEDYRDKVEVRDNYIDNQSAVFFSDAQDMVAKLKDILADPDRLQAISDAGFEHIRNHHLVEHCARYVIERVTENL